MNTKCTSHHITCVSVEAVVTINASHKPRIPQMVHQGMLNHQFICRRITCSDVRIIDLFTSKTSSLIHIPLLYYTVLHCIKLDYTSKNRYCMWYLCLTLTEPNWTELNEIIWKVLINNQQTHQQVNTVREWVSEWFFISHQGITLLLFHLPGLTIKE